MKKRSWIVLQIGARHNYLIPQYFAKNNLLAAFYTDFHSSHFVFNIFNLIPKTYLVGNFKRISNRKLPYELPKKLVKDNLFTIFFRSSSLIIKSISKRVLAENFLSSNAIYTNIINDDIELLIAAKNRGLYIVHEVIINPNINQIYLSELKKFPSLASSKSKNNNKKNHDKDLIKFNLADKILVPSEYIYKEIIRKGLSKNKISIVRPCNPNKNLLEIKTNPKKGRILFVGQISMLKGIHYFAKACRILANKQLNYEFRAAGKSFLNLNNFLLNGPKYLGHLNKEDLLKEYSFADVFVLPSLSDAFPTTHLEAMACGIPVIITNSCGSVVEDGENGFIVNSGQSDVLAEKIVKIVEDRSLREKFSKNARKKIQNYSISDFYEKLDKVLH